MRHDPLFLLWNITCSSAEDCRRLQRWLADTITPDWVFVDEVYAFPEGKETCRPEPHRLGDYFERVQAFASDESAPCSFRLLFQRRPTAPRFWKDLMARILQMLREQAAKTTTTLVYRGDEEPEFLVAPR
jgi:hypothetical protein